MKNSLTTYLSLSFQLDNFGKGVEGGRRIFEYVKDIIGVTY